MRLVSRYSAIHLRRLIYKHGQDWQKALWERHLVHAPRYEPDRTQNPCPAPDPWPEDGQGPAPPELKIALLAALHAEAAELAEINGNPDSTEDDAAEAADDYTWTMGWIKGLDSW